MAELLSIAGDQLARVALAVLAYQRTSSATLTGLTYALTVSPSTRSRSRCRRWCDWVWSIATGRHRRLAHGRTGFFRSTVAGARLVWSDPRLRSVLALCRLAGFYITPEAIAAPYAVGLGAGAGAVGLLMAADPAGSVLGGILAGRLIPIHTQIRIIGVLGVLAGLPLIICVLRPGLVVSMVLFTMSGMLATIYTVQGVTLYTRRLPDAMRSQGAGLLSSGLKTVQGLGALLAGTLADRIAPANTVAVAGVAGALVAVPIAVGWSRARRSDSDAAD